MEPQLTNWLSSLFDNVLANFIAAGVAGLLGTIAVATGIRKHKAGAPETTVNNSGNYVGNVGNGSTVHQDNTQDSYNTTINNNFGNQQNPATAGDTETPLVFAGAIALIGVILTGAKYLGLLVGIPLWSGGILLALSTGFFLFQRAYYSSAATGKAVMAWVTLAITSVAFSASIFAVQNPNSQYSLGHLSQVTERAVQPTDGWLTAIFNRISAFFRDTTPAEKIGLYIGLLVLGIMTALFIAAILRVLGSMLIPASSNGRVFKFKILQNLNNNFIESKWWGYLLASVASLALWFLATDTGTEWVLNVFQQVQDFINNLVKTA